MAVAAETSAAEWAAANGIVGAPLVGRSTPPGDLPITLITWRPELQGPPVVLYRIEGGGHTWPGGAQYLPGGVIGPTAERSTRPASCSASSGRTRTRTRTDARGLEPVRQRRMTFTGFLAFAVVPLPSWP